MPLGRGLGSGLDTSQRLKGLRLHQKIVLHFSEHLTALLSSTEERADKFAWGRIFSLSNLGLPLDLFENYDWEKTAVIFSLVQKLVGTVIF